MLKSILLAPVVVLLGASFPVATALLVVANIAIKEKKNVCTRAHIA